LLAIARLRLKEILMSDRPKVKQAENTQFKDALVIGLDEAFSALEESFSDLSDEQLQAFPIPGRNNIAWIVMETLLNFERFGVRFQTGLEVVDLADERFSLWWWKGTPRRLSTPEDSFPAKDEIMELLVGISAGAMAGIAAADEKDLQEACKAGDRYARTRADGYIRTVFHAMSHIRQIWLLRGALGLTDGKTFPRQHWA